MKKSGMRIVVLVFCLIGFCLTFATVFADEDGHRHRWGRARHQNEHRRHDFEPADNPVYAEQCGACHFAYPPGLLPSVSWREILSNLEDHHGVEVALETQARETLSRYLEANAADKSTSRRAAKLVKSLKGKAPARITETPYIRHKHDDIPPETFKRKSVGSFSNCTACHPGAQDGEFDDDLVAIPE